MMQIMTVAKIRKKSHYSDLHNKLHSNSIKDFDRGVLGFWGFGVLGFVWSLGVEVSPPLLDQDLCLVQAVKDFAVE